MENQTTRYIIIGVRTVRVCATFKYSHARFARSYGLVKNKFGEKYRNLCSAKKP